MKNKHRKLTELKKLPNNPRQIKSEDFDKLCTSIKNSPDYFEARPLILSDRTGELIIIAGNQRYEAAKTLKLKEVPTFLISDLTEEREKEIIIRDNVSNGMWDWDMLANEWDADELADWGIDVPIMQDFSEANQEIDIDGMDGQMVIKLNYSEDEYNSVREALAKVAETPEQAVWKLLKL